MRHWLAVLAVFAVCGAAAFAMPALADDTPEPSTPESETPGELARDGIERLMRALEAFVDMVPQYEMPEITEDGDIIIRRKRDDERPPEVDEDDDIDQTQT